MFRKTHVIYIALEYGNDPFRTPGREDRDRARADSEAKVRGETKNEKFIFSSSTTKRIY